MSEKLFFLASLVLALGLVATPAVADLVAHYPLDEGTGTIATDASGNGHDGAVKGNPEWIVGKAGKALEFTGASGGHVDLGTWDPSDGTDQLSFALWVRWNGLTGEWQGMISKRNSWGPPPIGEMMWFMELNANSGNLWFGRRDGGGVGSSQTLPEGEWQHLAVTCDGATAILYRDGAQANSGGFTLGSMTDAGLQFGSGYVGGGGPFNGAIDDVRIYNHALTADEVQDAMFGQVLQAYGPTPTDGAMHENTWANLSWTPGNSAVSHDVYFGDSFDDVNAGAESTFQGNQTGTFLVVGFPGFAFPAGLVPGTTYYWRIDEIEADGTTIHKGNVWSLTVPPKIAYNPNPPTGAKFIDPDVAIGWEAGFGTIIHNVYFGDNFDNVSAGTPDTSRGPVGDTSYVPGPLDLDKTYYWRIDEFDGAGTHTGDVWSFITSRPGGGVRADYYKGTNFETHVLTRTDP
ncbi:MAG: LamG domain-containing protein, partial [Planctomycetota bacterium]